MAFSSVCPHLDRALPYRRTIPTSVSRKASGDPVLWPGLSYAVCRCFVIRISLSPRVKIEFCGWGNLSELVFPVSSGRNWTGSSSAPLSLAALLVPLAVAHDISLGSSVASPRTPVYLRGPSPPNACHLDSSGDYGPFGSHPSNFLDHRTYG